MIYLFILWLFGWLVGLDILTVSLSGLIFLELHSVVVASELMGPSWRDDEKICSWLFYDCRLMAVLDPTLAFYFDATLENVPSTSRKRFAWFIFKFESWIWHQDPVGWFGSRINGNDFSSFFIIFRNSEKMRREEIFVCVAFRHWQYSTADRR